MPVLKISTIINAPIKRVFDLSRSIDLHVDSQAGHKEKAVSGRTTGLICHGEEVTWCATHFGIRQHLSTRITEMDAPHHFRDSQVSGIFQRFDHDHFFEGDDTTVMVDVFDYTSPLGLIGKLADRLFLAGYMTNLLQQRNEMIKTVAESNDWQRFVIEAE